MKTIMKINRKEMIEKSDDEKPFKLSEVAIRSFAKDIAKLLSNDEISEVHKDE